MGEKIMTNKLEKYLTEETKKPIMIISDPGGDWEGLYIKGKLYTEGHTIPRWEFVKALEKAGVMKKNSIDEAECDEDWISKIGTLPKKIEDVVMDSK